MGTRFLLPLAMAGVLQCVAQPEPPAPPSAPPKSRGAMGPWVMHGPTLGVGVMDIDADRARTLKLKDARGAEVMTVNDGSPAAKAGIRVGDVILEYNGQPVQDTEQLVRLVRQTQPGKQVKISLWRNGAPATVTATVEEAKMPGFDTDNWPFGGNMPPFPPMPSIDIPRIVTIFQSSALGTECESLGANPQLAEFFGVKDGLLVRSVARDSAAEKAGIKAGDVIVKVGDMRIGNTSELSSALRTARAKGGAIPVMVVRNRKEVALSVNLQEGGREHF
jgi:serine protease Do